MQIPTPELTVWVVAGAIAVQLIKSATQIALALMRERSRKGHR